MEAQRLSSEAYDESDGRAPMYYAKVQADVQKMREQKEREEQERQETFERAQAVAAAAEKAAAKSTQRTR